MNGRVSRLTLHFCLVAASVLPVSVAVSAAASKAWAADRLETNAARLYYSGRYEEALAAYVDLVVARRNPVYLCEIGRCHHRLGNANEAMRNLRDCLAQAKLDVKTRREFRTLLTEVESQPRAATQSPTGPPAGAPPPPPPPTGYQQQPQQGPPPAGPYAQPSPGFPPPRPAYPPPAGAPTPPPGAYPQPSAGLPPQPNAYPPAPGAPPPPPGAYPTQSAGQPPGQGMPPAGWGASAAPGQLPMGPQTSMGPSLGAGLPPQGERGSRTGAVVIGGVGLAAALGGATFGYLANNTFKEVGREYSAEKEKTGKRYNLFQFIGYGIGAVGLTTAVILFLRSGSSSERAQLASPSRLALELHPTGLSLHGRF